MSKKMKKIFSLMLVALVMLGVTACEQNVTIDTPKSEGLSFYAEIAMTRASINDEDGDKVWNTTWEGNETLTVYSEEYTELYKFTNSIEEPNMFSCTEEGVENIIGQNIIIELTHEEGSYISEMGKRGLLISESISEFNPAEPISLHARNSFLRYTYNGEGTVTLSLEYEGMPFITGDNTSGASTYTSSNTGEQWVSFDAPNVEDSSVVPAVLSYSINDIKVKETTINLAQGKVYNLGTLTEPSEWEISDGTRLWTTETADLFVAKNVTLSANNFCLHKVGDTAWGAGAKYGLVTAGTKNVDTAIGIYSANWAADITIGDASTTAHDIYFDKANSRLYVLTVGKTPADISAPTHSNSYNVAGTMNSWGGSIEGYKFTYSGDNVWHLVVDFSANAEFKVQLNNAWDTSYGYSNIQANVGKSLFSGSDNAKVKTTGTYEIWVIPSHTDAPLYIIKK